MKDRTDSLAVGVKQAVLQATHGRVGMLHVDHRGDEIVLHGQCPSSACKKLAQDAALLLIGDVPLVNKIEIR